MKGLPPSTWMDQPRPSAPNRTVTVEEAELLNVVLVSLLDKLRTAGVEMPSVSVKVGSNWVHFG